MIDININRTMQKILTALKAKGYIFLLGQEQVYVETTETHITKHKLYQLIPTEEYNRIYNKKKNEKYKYVKVEIFKTYKKVELLKKLSEIIKEVQEEE
jgi:hypothetical protein